MRLPLYQVDAFADALFQGNPAAVCPLEQWLPDSVLQAIASENNLSETAFYVGREGRYQLRWFTPACEVDLCGHATLAAAHVAFQTIPAPGNTILFDSRSGPLSVLRQGDLLTLDFPAQPAEPCGIPSLLASALGRAPQSCLRASDYLAVYADEQEILALAPDFRLLRELDLRGVIATAPGLVSDFVSRFFAPKYGIDEDPVTGSAHCTLAPYWTERLGRNPLEARQLSKRGGRLHCRVEGGRVHISGKAVPYLEGTITLPNSGL